jgi:hypothetical protein
MGATLIGWTDRDPYTVIEVSKDGKRITVQADKAERDKTWKAEVSVGGFAGHVSNNHSQRWTITRDTEGKTLRFSLRKSGRWVLVGQKDGHHSTRITLGKRVKFYDMNF